MIEPTRLIGAALLISAGLICFVRFTYMFVEVNPINKRFSTSFTGVLVFFKAFWGISFFSNLTSFLFYIVGPGVGVCSVLVVYERGNCHIASSETCDPNTIIK